jgi:lysophospholipase L1-like esterase
MMARLQNEVINAKPDLVIWQVGTNAVLRNLDPAETGKMIEDGVGRIQAAGSDVVLVDPQYSPATTSKPEGTGKMLSLMHKVAELRKVGIFPRFEVMKEWHESQQMAFDSFVISDGLHMNDWGYACFAQLLGDNIIKSVGQVKMGINEPQIQQAQKPL